MRELIQERFAEHRRLAAAVEAELSADIVAAAGLLLETLDRGGKILLFGNGGSAADAQHVAAELTGRFKLHRAALPAIALTTDTSALTAISNDYGFEQVFARQVEALARPGDLVVGYSTSGESANVVEGLRRGRALQCATIGLTGSGGGAVRPLCDICLSVPSTNTSLVQEMHLVIGHALCHLTEAALFSTTADSQSPAKVRPRAAA